MPVIPEWKVERNKKYSKYSYCFCLFYISVFSMNWQPNYAHHVVMAEVVISTTLNIHLGYYRESENNGNFVYEQHVFADELFPLFSLGVVLTWLQSQGVVLRSTYFVGYELVLRLSRPGLDFSFVGPGDDSGCED
ncbi:Ornithine carbamoyltransferase [Frankliniella fusca]|uniref:Ornithine carbamoyltransferase n=1 Tax=Frankliniella fusca TaxID=407009 RepID=A0AAE1GQD6_9NEOP|nr:Ornithine carbamoyltransferase [Frankliniella fusca]